jgi:hypothetical protein
MFVTSNVIQEVGLVDSAALCSAIKKYVCFVLLLVDHSLNPSISSEISVWRTDGNEYII